MSNSSLIKNDTAQQNIPFPTENQYVKWLQLKKVRFQGMEINLILTREQ